MLNFKYELDKLLQDIHPEKTLYPIERKLDRYLNSIITPQSMSESEMFRHLCEVYKNIFSITLDYSIDELNKMPLYKHYPDVKKYLQKEYGENFMEIAYHMYKTGVDGGIYSIIKKLSAHSFQEYRKLEIYYRVTDFLFPLRDDQLRLEVSREYYNQFQDILPSELKQNGLNYIMINLRSVLMNHPFLIKSIRDNQLGFSP